MAFTPVSSIAPVLVTVSGTVAVSNFPASQPVTGPLTNAELRAADVPVSQGAGGTAWAVVQATVPWVVDASGFPIPVTGPLTDAELRASDLAISAASLPLPDGAATEDTLAAVDGAVQDVALTAILERDKLAE